MVQVGSQVTVLLSEILKSPASPATAQLAHFIDTEEGMTDLAENLRAGNALAFIYLKQNVPGWVASGTHPQVYTREFILFVIASAGKTTRYYAREFVRQLSMLGLIDRDIISQLVERRNLDMLESVTNKYIKAERGDALFLEIRFVIDLMSPLFEELYFGPRVTEEVQRYYENPAMGDCGLTSASPSFFDTDALQVLYNLVYQDIHPYFEDNAPALFKVLFVLFDSSPSRSTVVQLYDLFLTKYPDCTDFPLLIAALAKADTLDSEIVEVVTKAFSYRSANPELVVQMLTRVLAYELDEDDMESYTRNMLKGVDTNRGCTHRLIKLLCSIYQGRLLYQFDTENALFIATVLKLCDERFTNLARQLVYTSTDNNTIIFSAFLYLITTNNTDQAMFETHAVNGGLFYHLAGPCRFICLKYLSLSLKNRDHFYGARILNRQPPAMVDFSRMLPLILNFIAKRADEFATEALFRMVKHDSSLLTPDLYDFVTEKFEKIDQMAALPVQHLFDIYNLLTVRLKRYNLEIVERVLNNELFDLFGLTFYYLSILMQETDLPRDFILNILGQDALWSERGYHLPLVLMLVSAHKQGLVGDAHVSAVCPCLGPYHAVVLLSKCGLRQPSGEPQANYLINGEFYAEWFLENFIDKKYCRMIISKMQADKNIEGGVSGAVIEKNARNIEFEMTLHSITEYFGI